MAADDLLDALERVSDASTFIAFLEALRTDWESALRAEKETPSSSYRSMHGWENTSIGLFLEAAIAGGNGTLRGGDAALRDNVSDWQQAARILYLGKIYE